MLIYSKYFLNIIEVSFEHRFRSIFFTENNKQKFELLTKSRLVYVFCTGWSFEDLKIGNSEDEKAFSILLPSNNMKIKQVKTLSFIMTHVRKFTEGCLNFLIRSSHFNLCVYFKIIKRIHPIRTKWLKNSSRGSLTVNFSLLNMAYLTHLQARKHQFSFILN